jgi:oxygen-dependent protoporphyrinogen oxidase
VSTPRVVIVGGGISGLASALRLRELVPDAKVTVVETSDRVGGKLRSHVVSGLTLDAGAESVLARRPEAVDLIAAAGLGGDLVHPKQVGASVLVEDELRPLPATQLLGIPYELEGVRRAGILDEPGLQRFAQEPTRFPTEVGEDISVGHLVADRMGQQVVDRLVEPLLGGVYAGHAQDLSLDMVVPGLLEVLGETGSLTKAVRALRARGEATGPAFAGIRGGLGRLPTAVATASAADLMLQTTVTGVSGGDAEWDVMVERDGVTSVLNAEAVVLACDGPTSGGLLRRIAPAAAAFLESIEYASVALVTFVFDAADVEELPPGTGFLVPPSAHRLVKAATYVSQKWGWVSEAFPDAVVVRVSVGRYGEESVLARSDDLLMRDALAELGAITGVAAQPRAWDVTRWDRSLPQYRVGHRAGAVRARAALVAAGQLEVCGAAVDGVGIPSCIASGQAAATRVAEGLRRGGE